MVDRPSLTGFGPTVTFGENIVSAMPQLLDADVSFSDPDNDFDGGWLTLSGLLAEDLVSVRNQGAGAGQIGLSGNNVTYAGTVIGVLSGGAGSAMIIGFNAAATSAAVDALVQNLTYANASNTPTASRTLVLNIVDGDGLDIGPGAGMTASFTQLTGAANPFDGFDVGEFAAPSFTDLDGDGDLDAVVGNRDGNLRVFRNGTETASGAFTQVTGIANPFDAIDVGNEAKPSFVDLDSDGDLDLVVGEDGGTLKVFQNGTSGAPGAFTELTGGANPFNGIDVGDYMKPSFFDLDDDGDLDLIAGEFLGKLFAYRNGTDGTSGAYTQLAGADNPVNGVDVGEEAAPSFVDIDGDGDLDAVVGERSGALNVFRNGSEFAPGAFVELTGASNPFDGVALDNYSLPAFIDIDGDGDLDVVVGNRVGQLVAFENTVSSGAPIVVTVTDENDAPTIANAIANQSATDGAAFSFQFATNVFADVDAGGTLTYTAQLAGGGALPAWLSFDAVTRTFSGTPLYSDAGTVSVDVVADDSEGGTVTDTFDIVVSGVNDRPTLSGFEPSVSFAEDTVNATPQLLDAVVVFTDPDNNFDGGSLTLSGLLAEDVVSVRNQGAGAGQIGLSGSNVTYAGTVIGALSGGAGSTMTITFNAAATSVSVDALIQNLTYANVSNTPTASRTLTLVIEDADGATATTAGLALNRVTGAQDPFDGITTGKYSTPALGDIDGDGDLDVIYGRQDGQLLMMTNTGTAVAPVFGASVQLGTIDVGADSSVALGDIDGDGDLDIVAGRTDGTLYTILNEGSSGTPSFVSTVQIGTIDVGMYSKPALGDIDGDGDLDIVAGNQNGTLFTIRNSGTANAPSFDAPVQISGVDVGLFSTPVLADIDGDGDLDVVSGAATSNLLLIQNTGTATVANFAGPVAIGTIGGGLGGGAPAIGDLDGDGDLDLITGNNGFSIQTLLNSISPDIVVTVTAQNDDPAAIGLPTDVTVAAETASNVDLSGITFSDADSGINPVTFTIQASAGTLSASDSGGVTVLDSGTTTMILAGTAADIDAYLNTASNIQYTGPSGVAGNDAATLTLKANDGGNSGSGGGGDVAFGTVNIDIAEAGSLVVTTLSDTIDAFDGVTSLREAIAFANANAGADTITFDAALDGTIRLGASGTLNVTEALTIDGDGRILISGDVSDNDTTKTGTDITDVAATVTAGTISDNVQIIAATAALTVENLTLTAGNAANEGGAIVAAGQNVTLTNAVIAGNRAGSGGGVFAGTVAASGSTIDGNVSTGFGGGIRTGGAVIVDSTISNNVSDSTGGGVFVSGTATLTDVTVSGNTAASNSGGVQAGSALIATNLTVTGNTAGFGGGGLGFGNVGAASSITNSIVLGNSAPGNADITAAFGFTSVGGNIIGTNVFSGSTDIGDTTAADVFAQTVDIGGGVLAGVLANNGGTVQTIALNAAVTNPALDASNGSAPATDSRGLGRVDHTGIANPIGGTGADLGAAEVQHFAPSGSDGTLTLDEDDYHEFTDADFGFTSNGDGDAFAGVTVTTLPLAGVLYLDDINGISVEVQAGEFISAADILAGNFYYLPDADQNGAAYASFTFQVKDDSGLGSALDTDATPNTITFNVTAVNDAPLITLQETLDVVIAEPGSPGVAIALGFGGGILFPAGGEITDSGPVKVVLADFDGNGYLDIATANNNATLTILLQDDCGCFYDAAQSPIVTTTFGYTGFATGDFDADGIVDLAVAGYSSQDVEILTGNGDGTFTSLAIIAAGAHPLDLAFASDLNGDGDGDFIVANDDGDVTVGLSDGLGGFTTSATSVGVSAGIIMGVAVGDLTGDASLDIAAVDLTNNTVTVLAGNGAGAFTPAGTYAVGAAPSDVTLGDVDGDGLLDIVVANGLDDTVSVLLGLAGGTFGAQQTFAVGGGPNEVKLADMDNDGDLDIVAVHDDASVHVLLGNGDGTFEIDQNPIDSNSPFTGVAIGNIDAGFEQGTPTLREFYEGSSLILAPGLVLRDIEGDAIQGASVFLDDISGPGGLTGDLLTATVTVAGITATWDATTFTLSFTGAASVADYQAVLRGVTFSSGSDPDDDGNMPLRVAGITVDDGGVDGEGFSAPILIGITSVADDAVTAQENAILSGDVFAANPTTADGGLLTIAAVNGVSAAVGSQITLTSGALLTLNADGTFDYDPNGIFDNLPDFATSGASNSTATDSFTYTIVGGSTATVTVTIQGVDSNDLLLGTVGADTLSGGLGNDTVNGGAGADRLLGGAGNDVYIDPTGDTIVEAAGGGTDLVTSAATFSLSGISHVENLTLTGAGDVNAIGNSADNVLTGNTGANRLRGGAGADTLIGGLGNDTYIDPDGDTILETAIGGIDTVESSTTALLAGRYHVENLTLTGTDDINATGNYSDNVLTGNDGANRLRGSLGTDTLIGGRGNDTYVGPTGDTIVEFANGGVDTVESEVTFTLGGIAHVENLTLTGTDAINGRGNFGDNVITGNSGANRLDGSLGADTLIGGLGNDVYVDPTGDVISELAGGGTDTVESSVTCNLNGTAHVEDLILTGLASIDGTGNGHANVITGNAGNNRLSGLAGIDTLIGGAGNDTYVNPLIDTIIELAGQGVDTVESGATISLAAIANVENLILTGTGLVNGAGNELNNVLSGNGSANILSGGDGNDTLAGAAGLDTLIGGLGNDTYLDPEGDIIQEFAGEGTDTISASISTNLSGRQHVENLILSGSGDINGTGNSYDNVITGNSGSNRLEGRGGADTLAGGLGNDTYVDPTGDLISESAGGGIDTVESASSFQLDGRYHVENLILTGTGDSSGIGNYADNVLTGSSGANRLRGSLGADTLDGGAGVDSFVFAEVVESTGAVHDVILRMDLAVEKFDFNLGATDIRPTSIAAGVFSGVLNAASFDANLAAAIGAAQMDAGQAVLFDPNGGDLNVGGQAYLVVDANNVAGYQAGQDYVVQLSNHTGTLTIDDFI